MGNDWLPKMFCLRTGEWCKEKENIFLIIFFLTKGDVYVGINRWIYPFQRIGHLVIAL